jgi:integrase
MIPENGMHEKRIVVWVQRFKGRSALMLQWHDPDTGKRKSESAGTADVEKAEQARSDKEYELNHGLHQDRSRMTWAKFRELFEDEFVSGKRDSTRENYASMFDLFERLCHPQLLRNITERTLSAFVAQMRKERGRSAEGMMPSSIKVRLQFLHAALAWAVEQKLMGKMPKFPKIRVPKKKPQPVPTESFERLVSKATDPAMRAFLHSGWLAGLRFGEAYNLEWEATTEAPYVDLASDRIILPAEIVKGDADQWIPLDPALRKIFEGLPRTGRRVFQFTAERGNKPTSRRTVRERLKLLAKAAGVRLSMKSLRRGFGCRYAGKVPAQVLQKLMRHSTITITMEYYANVDDAVMDAVLGSERNTPRNNETMERNLSEDEQTQVVEGKRIAE